MRKHNTRTSTCFSFSRIKKKESVDSPLEKTERGCGSERNAPAATARCLHFPKRNRPTDSERSPISTAGQALVRTSSNSTAAAASSAQLQYSWCRRNNRWVWGGQGGEMEDGRAVIGGDEEFIKLLCKKSRNFTQKSRRLLVPNPWPISEEKWNSRLCGSIMAV